VPFSAGAYTVSDKPLRLKTLSGHARLGKELNCSPVETITLKHTSEINTSLAQAHSQSTPTMPLVIP